MPPSIARRTVNERSTLFYEGTLASLYDPDDPDSFTPLALSEIVSAKMYLTDVKSGSVINSRNGIDIRNTGPCTINATSGRFVLTLSSADNQIVGVGNRGSKEEHEVTLDIVYDTDKRLTHTLVVFVVRLVSITE